VFILGGCRWDDCDSCDESPVVAGFGFVGGVSVVWLCVDARGGVSVMDVVVVSEWSARECILDGMTWG
jgi:hypothetical protein